MTRIRGIGNGYRQKCDGKITHALRQHNKYALDAEHQRSWPYIRRSAFQSKEWQAEEHMRMAQVYSLNDGTTRDKIVANHEKAIEEDNEDPGTPRLYPSQMRL